MSIADNSPSLPEFDPDEPRLTITFDTVEDAKRFKEWLCDEGEAGFFDHERELQSRVTRFNFHEPGGCAIIAKSSPRKSKSE